MTICNSFKIDFENKVKDKSQDNNNNLFLRDYLDVPNNKEKNQKSNNNINNNNSNNNNNNNEKKWERFGGKQPFSHINEDPFDCNNNNEIYQKKVSNKKLDENCVAMPKKAPNEDKKEKDPMVWDPPEDRGNKVPNKAVVKPRQSNAQVKPAPSKNAGVNMNPYK